MTAMPVVSLELLRRGPAHNQLLSPLTDYFALVGNHEPQILRVPWEQAAFDRKLPSFRYQVETQRQTVDAEDVRRELLELLMGIRGLTRELTRAADQAKRITLELVITAKELSLLPFELVFPPGQPARELCSAEVLLLRRTRRVPNARMAWPYRPQILLAYASPQRSVPGPEHALAIRETLEPWLAHVRLTEAQRGDAIMVDKAVDEFEKYVHLLPDASLPKIREACERRRFTHVHILAHGAAVDGTFGLELCHPTDRGRADVVTGERLASVLTSGSVCARGGPPACVTIAACDVGGIRDVIGSGSSMAHDLHDAGIPLVVASQFPLSKRGSVMMTRDLYGHLLWVCDPRDALSSTRAELSGWGVPGVGQFDWASVVAYGALPADLEAQLPRAQVNQYRRAMDSLVSRVDEHVDPRIEDKDHNEALGEPLAWTERGLDDLERRGQSIDREGRPYEDYVRARAGTHLRVAEAFRRAISDGEARDFAAALQHRGHEGGPASQTAPLREDDATRCYVPDEDPRRDAARRWSASRKFLRRSRELYQRSYGLTGSPTALLKAISCAAFLREPLNLDDVFLVANQLASLTALQRTTEERAQRYDRAWVELWVMLDVARHDLRSVDDTLHEARARDIERLETLLRQPGKHPVAVLRRQLDRANPWSFDFYALRRQLQRYKLFVDFGTPAPHSSAVQDMQRAALSSVALPPTERWMADQLLDLLDERGARRRFSAIVDWRSMADGGEVTIDDTFLDPAARQS